MLPSELLAVWKRKGVISPRYAKLSNDNLEVASSLIEVYRSHLGKKKSVLKEFVDEIEEKGYEYRFVRGLSILLDRRSRFKCNNKLNSVDLRRKVFHAAAKLGLPTTGERRTRIIESAASELRVTGETVEELLYADLDTELILEAFEPLAPVELLQEYNLSLTQTLLFDSTEVTFTSSGNWQKIFYTVRKLGLIYEAYQDEGFWVKVDGPASLFKLTRRYGTATAKLLPVIVANQGWTIEAKILWKFTNEICSFLMDSSKNGALFRKPRPSIMAFDSTIEEDFAKRFQGLSSGWILKREPEPVLAGKQVIIPDFSLEKENIRVYVEIIGFWTVEYLLRKIEKLKKVDVEMLVLVDENLLCEKLTTLKELARLNIIYYRDKISLAPILRYLEQAFREVKAKQIEFVKDLQVVFMEPIVVYGEFAERIGVSADAVKAALTEKQPQGYVAMPNELVRNDVLEQAGKRIEGQIDENGQLCFSEAVRVVEALGVNDATSALEALGYKVVWRGISSEKAEVVRQENTNLTSGHA